MEKQYIIKHILTNKEQIMNAEEKTQFYSKQNPHNYIESELLEIETEKETNWKEEIFLAILGIAIVILGTKIIVEWL
tara:strand:- start:291 stop:521 length:231 start_codon:yes stop_codon:yes gene_type:complete